MLYIAIGHSPSRAEHRSKTDPTRPEPTKPKIEYHENPKPKANRIWSVWFGLVSGPSFR